MEDVLIILITIGLIGFSMVSSIRKALKKYDVEMKSAPKVPTIETEDFQTDDTDYFTYETASEEAFTVRNTVKQAKAHKGNRAETPAVAEVQAATEPTSIEFDLRQAVIYQTILNNDYVAEMK